MGQIRMPPSDICYPRPKTVGPGYEKAKIIGRAMIQESFHESGDYMRILDFTQWEDGHKELRFCYFYRKSGGTENDWIFGQGAGHMKVTTFYDLIRKAANNPDYGDFERIFDKFIT